MPHVLSWNSLLFGALLCVAGWTLYWVGLHLAGGVAGALFGVMATWIAAILLDLPRQQTGWMVGAGGVAGLVVGLWLMRGLHRFFFFMLGALLGVWLGYAALNWLAPRWDWLAAHPAAGRVLVVGLTSILCGLAMVRSSRPIVTAVMALAGALLVGLSLSDPLFLLGVPPLAIGSFFLQTGLLRWVGAARSHRPRQDE